MSESAVTLGLRVPGTRVGQYKWPVFGVKFAIRTAIASVAIIFFALSHTPYGWPIYPVAFVPLVCLWRMEKLAPQSVGWLVFEAIVVGSFMGWTITRFVPPEMPGWSPWLHLLCCLMYSSLTVAIALSLRFSQAWGLPWAAVTAVVAVGVEYTQARILGVTWILSNPALAIAATPLAQWSAVLTPFGLSALLYWINFSWLPDFNSNDIRWRWAGPLGAALLTAGLWLGGMFLESQAVGNSPPFSAMLVQPGGPADSPTEEEHETWRALASATSQSLVESGTVDLVLWPEACLQDSQYAELAHQHSVPQWDAGQAAADTASNQRSGMNLAGFRQRLASGYGTNSLVGICLVERVMTEKYGLTIPELRRYNCGCLIAADGRVSCHKKLAIMPLREEVPYWFDWGWLRNIASSRSNGNSNITEGRKFETLEFTDAGGHRKRSGVVICCESWLPWLPQYHCQEPLDAICHLAYDGDFKDHPEYTQRMLLTIRLRAIETRTWQLVCTHFSGTAVIDPRGRIVKQLPPGPGVLRTDEL
ncbi:MAG: hypothetical protein KF752_14905 [Pirellulaceae bacterium]|nr:hypothetical protein [Pirellulaceae bacterium]